MRKGLRKHVAECTKGNEYRDASGNEGAIAPSLCGVSIKDKKVSSYAYSLDMSYIFEELRCDGGAGVSHFAFCHYRELVN